MKTRKILSPVHILFSLFLLIVIVGVSVISLIDLLFGQLWHAVFDRKYKSLP